ncbi:MAG TPA: hypothetical protein VMQ44_01800 [Candidatus Saccharimonadales bacterium]|nr:hypothetical protein [Candidatus Saccharimonadales bacterium]
MKNSAKFICALLCIGIVAALLAYMLTSDSGHYKTTTRYVSVTGPVTRNYVRGIGPVPGKYKDELVWVIPVEDAGKPTVIIVLFMYGVDFSHVGKGDVLRLTETKYDRTAQDPVLGPYAATKVEPLYESVYKSKYGQVSTETEELPKSRMKR